MIKSKTQLYGQHFLKDENIKDRIIKESDIHFDDVVLEIDETMLKNEIRKMRQQRLQENNLRMAIRNEIQDIFGDLGIQPDGGWVYGENKPRNSRAGSVATAFPGIGFMK